MPSEGSADGEIHLKKTFLLAVVTWGNSSIYLARACVRGIQTTQNYMSASHKRKANYPNLALGFFSLLCCAVLVPFPFTQPSPSLLAKWANAYFLSSLLPQLNYHPSHSLEAFLSTPPVVKSYTRLPSGARSHFLRNTFADPFPLPSLRWYLFTIFTSWPCSSFVILYLFVWH